jgi:NAD(P)H-nitrite reductase large subunit
MNNKQPNKQEIICFCTGTTKAQIEALISNGMNTIAEIAHQTGATTGCGACDYSILKLLNEKPQSTQ